MNRLTCPSCGSDEIKELAGSYPQEYECEKCKFVFLESGKALTDE